MPVQAAVCGIYATAISPATPINDHCHANCPDSSWYKLNGQCYKASPTPVSSAYDARQYCFDLAGDLPTITNGAQQTFITYLLNNNATGSSMSAYIGFNRIASNGGAFTQIDGTSAVPTYWAPGEPAVTTDYWCTVFQLENATDSSWKASLCCSLSPIVPWVICQKPAVSSVMPVPADNDTFAIKCYGAIDDCASNPCASNATCVDHVLSYVCACPSGYSGNMCNIAASVCDSSPCQHGATCVSLSTPHTGYTCSCATGYTGINCETVTDACMSYPCQYNGTCNSGGSSYTCSCPVGTSGMNCETNYDDCVNVTCSNGGTCIDRVNTFTCHCANAFAGPQCQYVVACSWPLVIHNATRNATGSPLPSTTGPDAASYLYWETYDCDAGQKFPDMTRRKTFQCTDYHTWNDTVASCSAHCDKLPSIMNAMAANANTAVGNTVNFTCNTGFILPDNTTRRNTTCLPDRTWTNDFTVNNTVCNIRHCPPLPAWQHQTVDTWNDTYGTTVTFWCDVGYVVFDNTTARTIKCLADGTWSADLPPCNPVRCPIIQLPSGVTRNTSENTYMTYTQYSCSGNNRMLDGSTYRITLCDATSEWSDDITDCRADRCFPLPYVANATPSTTDADYWTMTTLTCIKGHKFFKTNPSRELNQDTMTCQSNGWWSPILTSCKPILCPAIPTAQNILPNTTNNLYGTVVNYTCLRGYYVNPKQFDQFNTMLIECQETKIWTSNNIPDCWPTWCEAPPAVNNGSRILPANYNYSSQVHYECDKDFKFYDGRKEKNISCTETGNWNETDVSCRKDRCDPINITDYSTPSTTNTTWNTVVLYDCIKGYKWPSDKTVRAIRCDAGTWNGSVVEDCIIKHCPPVQVEMGNATANSTQDTYMTQLEYRCHTGYKHNDNAKVMGRSCDENELWQPQVFPSCNIIHCPTVMDVENATRDTNETYYNNKVTFSCLPGYQFPDKTKQKQIVCTENETWTDYPPPCEVVFCPPLPYWSDIVFNSTDNNFLSVVTYWCPSGYRFKGYPPGNQTILSSMCLASKTWYPSISDCLAESAINADIKGKTYNSPQAVPIGTVACTVMCVVLAAVVLLDANKLISDLRLMKANVKNLMNAKSSNKVSPGGA